MAKVMDEDMRKGQIAIEFLVIIGILSLAIIPILFAMHWNASNSPDRLAISKGTFSASRMAAAIDSVGSIGEGAELRTQVEMPNLGALKVQGNEVVLSVRTTYGDVVILQPTDYTIQSIGVEKLRAEGTYMFDIYSDSPGIVTVRLVE